MHIIEQAGRALYGQHWVGRLADDLGIHPRLVRRISAGQEPLRLETHDKLARLCLDRRDALANAVEVLLALNRER